jgi:tRNA nucleotidyltransferase (CCA-adding enzyme)
VSARSQVDLGLSVLEPGLAGNLDRLCRLVESAGGRAYLAGGAVRDRLLGRQPVELDVEVFGLAAAGLRELLSRHWGLDEVGGSFAVLKLRGSAIDVSLPRTERKTGTGHRDFEVSAAPEMPPEEASRRRDFTVNSMLYDPLRHELVDAYGGRSDLADGRLRHTSERFSEDPLRVLRGMHFVARFELTPEPATLDLCRGLSMEELPRERVFEEWRKLLLSAERISLGLDFLRDVDWLRFFPELEALVGCEQDPIWHPEGDVWVHTGHVLNAFAEDRRGDDKEDLIVGLACLCHDLGKPATTSFERGRVRSIGHEAAGEEPTRRFLDRLTRQSELIEGVVPLVEHHLKPRQLYDGGAGDAAVRRLAQKVGRIDRLVRVARADARGRPPLRADDDPPGRWLLERAQALELADRRPQPLVQGRHLLERGLEAGPHFGPILDRCFEAQLDGRFTSLESGLSFLEDLLAERKEEPLSDPALRHR